MEGADLVEAKKTTARKAKAKDDDTLILNASTCLALAGQTLLDATEMAKFLNDNETMLSIAAGWIELSGRFDDSFDSNSKRPLGFSHFPLSKESDDDEN